MPLGLCFALFHMEALPDGGRSLSGTDLLSNSGKKPFLLYWTSWRDGAPVPGGDGEEWFPLLRREICSWVSDFLSKY